MAQSGTETKPADAGQTSSSQALLDAARAGDFRKVIAAVDELATDDDGNATDFLDAYIPECEARKKREGGSGTVTLPKKIA